MLGRNAKSVGLDIDGIPDCLFSWNMRANWSKAIKAAIEVDLDEERWSMDNRVEEAERRFSFHCTILIDDLLLRLRWAMIAAKRSADAIKC